MIGFRVYPTFKQTHDGNIMYHGQNVVYGIRFMVIHPIMGIRITRILTL
jgi:hypothetical protein